MGFRINSKVIIPVSVLLLVVLGFFVYSLVVGTTPFSGKLFQSLTSPVGWVLHSSGTAYNSFQCNLAPDPSWENVMFNITVSRDCNQHTGACVLKEGTPYTQDSACSGFVSYSTGVLMYKSRVFDCPAFTFTAAGKEYQVDRYFGYVSGVQKLKISNVPNYAIISAPNSKIFWEAFYYQGCLSLPGACVPGSFRCTGSTLERCDDSLRPDVPNCGAWAFYATCNYGCAGATCNCPTNACTKDTDIICSSSTSYYTCEYKDKTVPFKTDLGKCLVLSTSTINVPSGYKCSNNKLIRSCSDIPANLVCSRQGDQTCIEGSRYECTFSDGCFMYTLKEKCTHTCQVLSSTNTQCVCPPAGTEYRVDGILRGIYVNQIGINRCVGDTAISYLTGVCPIELSTICTSGETCVDGACKKITLTATSSKDVYSINDAISLSLRINTGTPLEDVTYLIDLGLGRFITNTFRMPSSGDYTTTISIPNPGTVGTYTYKVQLPKFGVSREFTFKVTNDFNLVIKSESTNLYSLGREIIEIRTDDGVTPIDAQITATATINGKPISPIISKSYGLLLLEFNNLESGTLKIEATAVTPSGLSKKVTKEFPVTTPRLTLSFESIDLLEPNAVKLKTIQTLIISATFKRKGYDGLSCIINYWKPDGQQYTANMQNTLNGKYQVNINFDQTGVYYFKFRCQGSTFEPSELGQNNPPRDFLDMFSITVPISPNIAFCGDGFCSSDENYETCPRDCRNPPPAPTLLYLGGGLAIIAFVVFMVLKFRRKK